MFTPDEVAAVVDLFGALTPAEAERALSELAYRRGESPPEAAIDEARAAFAVVAVDVGRRLLAVGPAAFPTLPEGAEDLPHILDVEPRDPDRGAVADAAASRLRTEAALAATLGDGTRAAALREVSYDLEAWGDADLGGVRALLSGVGDGTN